MIGGLKMTRRWYFIIGVLMAIIMLLIIVRGNLYDTVFSVLGWVKEKSGEQVNIEEVYKSESLPPDHVLWNELVKAHVNQDGWVNYNGIKVDQKKLDEYLGELSSHPPSHSWLQEEELAYWINAYNAFTIQLILDHYPVKSIKDIGGSIPMINSPWDIKFFKIGDVAMDLNTIEHDILRKKLNEPRIHFAINCASISCPLLRTEAYTADKLEFQLEEQAKIFLNDPAKNILSPNEPNLSPIFKWFKSDFITDQSLVEYINQYAEVKISPTAKLKWMDYNWLLNETY
jgi:hypothetical protein